MSKSKWIEGGRKQFSDLLEAFSRSHCTLKAWLTHYRELVIVVNQATKKNEEQEIETIIPPHEILQWKLLVQGGTGIDKEESVTAQSQSVLGIGSA